MYAIEQSNCNSNCFITKHVNQGAFKYMQNNDEGETLELHSQVYIFVCLFFGKYIVVFWICCCFCVLV